MTHVRRVIDLSPGKTFRSPNGTKILGPARIVIPNEPGVMFIVKSNAEVEIYPPGGHKVVLREGETFSFADDAFNHREFRPDGSVSVSIEERRILVRHSIGSNGSRWVPVRAVAILDTGDFRWFAYVRQHRLQDALRPIAIHDVIAYLESHEAAHRA